MPRHHLPPRRYASHVLRASRTTRHGNPSQACVIDITQLESAEFCRRRYDNFSTLIIMPIFAIVIAALLFSLIGTREITVTSTGEIMPASSIIRIQSTSGKRIITNHLRENRNVRKGETLLVYDNGQNAAQLAEFHTQLSTIKRRQHAITQLKAGLVDDSVDFTGPDEFGYGSMLADYRARKAQLNSEAAQQSQTATAQNDEVAATRTSIDDQIAQNQERLDDYAELRSAIVSGSDLPSDNTFQSTYELFRAQIRNVMASGDGTGSSQAAITAQTLADIDDSVRQLNETNGTLRTQQASTGTAMAQNASAMNDVNALQAQYLLNADKELAEANATRVEMETNITLANATAKDSTVTAPADGTIHLNASTKGMRTIPTGSVVAELYPPLRRKTPLDMVFPVTTDEIDSVHVGQSVRLSSYRHSAKPLVLMASVTSIATSPTRTESGNYFEVRARVRAGAASQLNRLRYGLTGKVSVITGKKTFFAYYRDKILHP